MSNTLDAARVIVEDWYLASPEAEVATGELYDLTRRIVEFVEGQTAKKLATCYACLGEGGPHIHSWCKEIDDRRWDQAGLQATVDTLTERLAPVEALLRRCVRAARRCYCGAKNRPSGGHTHDETKGCGIEPLNPVYWPEPHHDLKEVIADAERLLGPMNEWKED